MGGYDIFKETKIRRFWASQPDSAWRPLLLKRLYPYMDAIQRQPAGAIREEVFPDHAGRYCESILFTYPAMEADEQD